VTEPPLQPEKPTVSQELARQQAKILSGQDQIVANSIRVEKGLELALVNSSAIIAGQDRIKDKESHLDRILKNQAIILDDLQTSANTIEELRRRAANQTATIVSYQQIILANQEKLDRILLSQAKIVSNQEQRVIPNFEKVLANQEVIRARQQKLEGEH
jgi:hypothetical protein